MIMIGQQTNVREFTDNVHPVTRLDVLKICNLIFMCSLCSANYYIPGA